MPLRRFKPGSIFPKIIEIGAGKNLCVGVTGDAAIKIGLAKETAIDRIVWCVRVASVMLSMPPLTATASGPCTLDKTAVNRACTAKASLWFVIAAIPVPIA